MLVPLGVISVTFVSEVNLTVQVPIAVGLEMLASSPHFQASEWPNLREPAYVGGVYRAYKVEPYFITDGTTAADNTRQNIRDRDDRTPMATEPSMCPMCFS